MKAVSRCQFAFELHKRSNSLTLAQSSAVRNNEFMRLRGCFIFGYRNLSTMLWDMMRIGNPVRFEDWKQSLHSNECHQIRLDTEVASSVSSGPLSPLVAFRFIP